MKEKHLFNSERILTAITLTISLACPFTVRAEGKDIGNGGDAIVCRDSAGMPAPNKALKNSSWIQLYDSFRASDRGFKISIPGATVKEKTEELFKRLASFDPAAVLEFKKEFAVYSNPSNFKSGRQLPEISDSMESDIPVGCHLEQLALNRIPRYQEDSIYQINVDLLQAMDFDDQALTPFHEILQFFSGKGWLRKADALDSQYFVGKLGADLLKSLTSNERLNFFGIFGFRNFYLGTTFVSGIDFGHSGLAGQVSPGKFELSGVEFDSTVPTAVVFSFFPKNQFSVLSVNSTGSLSVNSTSPADLILSKNEAPILKIKSPFKVKLLGNDLAGAEGSQTWLAPEIIPQFFNQNLTCDLGVGADFGSGRVARLHERASIAKDSAKVFVGF